MPLAHSFPIVDSMTADTCCDTLENIFRGSRHFGAHKISWVEKTASTNDDLKAYWEKPPIPQQLRIADFQTAGRGQLGRKWQASAGQSLLFSFSLPDFRNEFPLSLLTGLALYKALSRLARDSSGLWLKWPNDVWLGQRKLAGILCESSVSGDVTRWVVGAGVNLLPLNDPETVSASFCEIAESCCRQDILCEFFAIFDELLLTNAEVLAEQWTKAAALFWQTRFLFSCSEQQEVFGIPLCLEPSGALMVKPDGNEKSRRLLSATLKPVF